VPPLCFWDVMPIPHHALTARSPPERFASTRSEFRTLARRLHTTHHHYHPKPNNVNADRLW
jgi:hypothetical protein